MRDIAVGIDLAKNVSAVHGVHDYGLSGIRGKTCRNGLAYPREQRRSPQNAVQDTASIRSRAIFASFASCSGTLI